METLLLTYWVVILFPLAVLEWPLVTLISGFLVWIGFFNFSLTLLILLIADVLTDIWYYRLGTRVHHVKRAQQYLVTWAFLQRNLSLMSRLRSRRAFVTMFFGKWAYGISLPIIMSAGMCKMGLSRFLIYSIPVSIIQTGWLFLIGFVLWNGYHAIDGYIQYPSIVVTIWLIIIVVVYYYMTKIFANEFDTTKHHS